MDEPIDRRLHEAGRRLRDAAPTEGATDAALDTLDGSATPSRRVRWIVPIALVSAAAAVVGVLVVNHPDESVRVVPADGGPPVVAEPTTTEVRSATSTAPAQATPSTVMTEVTVAPTTSSPPTTTIPPTTSSTTTTPPTSTVVPPPVGPAFVGNLPLDAPATIVGCPGTLGDLAAAVPVESWPIVSLACAGDHAVVVSATHPDGSNDELRWTSAGWENRGSGTSHPCDPAEASDICAAFGDPEELYDVDRPLPPAWLVEDPNFRPAVDATEVVASLGVSVAGDAEAFATALEAALQAITSGDPVPRVEHEVLEEVPVVVVTLRGIPDDSSSQLTYVVRYGDVDGTLAPLDALSFVYCDRGVTNDGLCL